MGTEKVMEVICERARDGETFIFCLLHPCFMILFPKMKSSAHNSESKTPKISMKNYLEASSLRSLEFPPDLRPHQV